MAAPEDIDEITRNSALAVAGDREAMGRLWCRLRNMVLATCIKHCQIAPEDAAQDAWIVALRKVGQLRNPAMFPAWMERVAFSAASNLRRTMSRHRDHEHHPDDRYYGGALCVADPKPGPVEAAEINEAVRAVRAALDDLPVSCRTTARMFYLHGAAIIQIAAALGVPEGTVKRRLWEARRLLRLSLAPIAASA